MPYTVLHMSQQVSAAVLDAVGEPVKLVDLDLADPGPSEVVVLMGATGVCRSDISVLHGRLPNPLPVVLGHEGAGTVVSIGAEVSDIKVGDHVVLSWLAQCGECFFCTHDQPQLCKQAISAMGKGTLLDGTTRFSRAGSPIFQMAGLGTFATHCVVP